MATVLKQANAVKLRHGLKTTTGPGLNGNFELWTTGTLSNRAKQELQARGFKVVEHVGDLMEIVD